MYFPILPTGTYCSKCGMTDEEQLIMDYWYQVNNFVMTDINNAWKKDIYGYDSECYFNSINNFHYLLSLLLQISREQAMDSTKDLDYFYEEYNIDCIIKTFMCHGYNIKKALAVFGMAENIPYPDSPDVPLDFSSTPSSDCICSSSLYSYIPIPIISGATITWSRDAVAGISNPSATGQGAISETLINTTTATVTTYYIITITNGDETYTETISVCVKPVPLLTSSTAPIVMPYHGHDNLFNALYTPTSNIVGATFEWIREYVSCVEEPVSSGTGSINELLTVEPRCTVYYTIRPCYDGCCGDWELLQFTPAEI